MAPHKSEFRPCNNRQCDNKVGLPGLQWLPVDIIAKFVWPESSRKYMPFGPRFNIKMSSYQYRKSHCGDKTVVRSSYLHNGISYAGKTTSLYWIRALHPVVFSYCLLLIYLTRGLPNDLPQQCTDMKKTYVGHIKNWQKGQADLFAT